MKSIDIDSLVKKIVYIKKHLVNIYNKHLGAFNKKKIFNNIMKKKSIFNLMLDY